MFHPDDPLILASLVLQLSIIVFLLKGALRKYPLVLAYSLLRLFTSVTEVIVRQKQGNQTLFFRQIYYSDRVILNLVLFVMVSAILFRLLEGKPQRSAIVKALGGIVATVLLLPFAVISRPFTVRWLNGMSQVLYFGSGIAILLLWTVLMNSRPRDEQLLKFALGLGVAITGAAITFGLRQWIHSPRLVWMPNLFFQLTHVLGLFIWCWAFRSTPQAGADPAHMPPAASKPGVPNT